MSNFVSFSKEQSESVSIYQLTDDQRRQIYEQEKHRIEQASPILSKRAKLLIAVYFLGCLLIYFGIPSALMDYIETRQWKYQPEPDIVTTLFNAVIKLIRPFLAVLLTFWIVLIPAGIIWGIWSVCINFIKFLKGPVNKIKK